MTLISDPDNEPQAVIDKYFNAALQDKTIIELSLMIWGSVYGLTAFCNFAEACIKNGLFPAFLVEAQVARLQRSCECVYYMYCSFIDLYSEVLVIHFHYLQEPQQFIVCLPHYHQYQVLVVLSLQSPVVAT